MFGTSLVQALVDLTDFAAFTPQGQWRLPDQSVARSQVGELPMLRLDKVSHPGCPQMSGNKLYKLLPNLSQCLQEQASIVRSFGGRWSNHVWALSAACDTLNRSSGRKLMLEVLVRGERPKSLTPTLSDAQAFGAQLNFVPRQFYDKLAYSAPQVLEKRLAFFQQGGGGKQVHYIPSGGSNTPGLLGAACLGLYLAKNFPGTDIYCAAGTGGFAAGLALGIELTELSLREKGLRSSSLPAICAVCVAESSESVARRNSPLLDDCYRYLQKNPVLLEHFGVATDQLVAGIGAGEHEALRYLDCTTSFASLSPALRSFREALEIENKESVDPVYVLPLSYYLHQQLTENPEFNGRKALVLHTGGQQGARTGVIA